jgi:hypothetical protein
VDESTRELLRAADWAVRRLVEACRKGCAVYASVPKAAAQVSRTGKWHLNAITDLRTALGEADADAAPADGGEQAS